MHKDFNNNYNYEINNKSSEYKPNNSVTCNNKYIINNSLYKINNNEFNINNNKYNMNNEFFQNNNKYFINGNNHINKSLNLNYNYLSNNIFNNNEYNNNINTNYNNRFKIGGLYINHSNRLMNKTLDIDPDFNFNLSEFIKLNQIGKGSEGTIYSVRWIKNNKKYALKKGKIKKIELAKKSHEEIMMLKKFSENTGSDGVISIYGDLCVENENGYYDYYEIMELAEMDWDLEIKNREKINLYYEENELMKIM